MKNIPFLFKLSIEYAAAPSYEEYTSKLIQSINDIYPDKAFLTIPKPNGSSSQDVLIVSIDQSWVINVSSSTIEMAYNYSYPDENLDNGTLYTSTLKYISCIIDIFETLEVENIKFSLAYTREVENSLEFLKKNITANTIDANIVFYESHKLNNININILVRKEIGIETIKKLNIRKEEIIPKVPSINVEYQLFAAMHNKKFDINLCDVLLKEFIQRQDRDKIWF